MRKFIEASAILSCSIIATAVMVVAVLPMHPRSLAEAAQPPGIVHAVSTSGDQGPVVESGCPYLAAIAASSACPALPETAEATRCPFLDGQRSEELPTRQRKLTGQHT